MAEFKVTRLADTAKTFPKGTDTLPIPTLEELANMLPLNCENAPWTVRFC